MVGQLQVPVSDHLCPVLKPYVIMNCENYDDFKLWHLKIIVLSKPRIILSFGGGSSLSFLLLVIFRLLKDN